MTQPRNHKHEYSTLADIINMFPVRPGESKQVNTYGIVIAYDKEKNEVTLMDETRESHSMFINTLYDPKHVRKAKRKDPGSKLDSVRLPCKTGDIIRIHRLNLERNHTLRSYKVSDLVVFRNFKEKEFCPTHVSSNPSFSSTDTERVKKLKELGEQHLMRAEVKLFHSVYSQENSVFLITNTAFQVLAVQPLDKCHIIVCWNGKPFSKYPCHQSVPLDIIFEKLKLSKRTTEIYTNEFVRQLYEAEKLVFITVYGDLHRLIANKLKSLDVVAIYNLVIKPDKFFFGKYSYLMFESDKYGRVIRFCSPKSSLATTLQKQIEDDFYFDDDFSMSLNNSKIALQPSQSKDVEKVEVEVEEEEEA